VQLAIFFPLNSELTSWSVLFHLVLRFTKQIEVYCGIAIVAGMSIKVRHLGFSSQISKDRDVASKYPIYVEKVGPTSCSSNRFAGQMCILQKQLRQLRTA
jgi:hypothetical protein